MVDGDGSNIWMMDDSLTGDSLSASVAATDELISNPSDDADDVDVVVLVALVELEAVGVKKVDCVAGTVIDEEVEDDFADGVEIWAAAAGLAVVEDAPVIFYSFGCAILQEFVISTTRTCILRSAWLR